MLLYTIQIFSLLAVIIASLCQNKKKILKWVSITNASNFLVMLIAQKTDGWASSLITVIRGLLFTQKDKFKTNFTLVRMSNCLFAQGHLRICLLGGMNICYTKQKAFVHRKLNLN